MTYVKVGDKNGAAVRVCSVRSLDDIVVTTQSGQTIRLSAKDISQIGRVTMGVKLVNVEKDDCVKDIALLTEDGIIV